MEAMNVLRDLIPTFTQVALILCLLALRAAAAAEPVEPYEYVGAVEGERLLDGYRPFSDDSAKIVTFSERGIRVWDTHTLKRLATTRASGGDDGYRFVDAGRLLFLAGHDQLSLVNASTGALKSKTRVPSKQSVLSAASDDGRRFVTLGDDKSALIWSPGADRPDQRIVLPAHPCGAAFDPPGKSLLVWSYFEPRTYHLFDVRTGNEKFPLPYEGCLRVPEPPPSFDRSGARVLVPCEHGFRVFDARTGRLLVTGSIGDQNLCTSEVAFSEDGSLILLVCERGLNYGPAFLFDSATGRLLHRLGSLACQVLVTPDRKWAVIDTLGHGEAMDTTQVWNLSTERRVQALKKFGRVSRRSSALSPDGNLIAQFMDESAYLWRRRDHANRRGP